MVSTDGGLPKSYWGTSSTGKFSPNPAGNGLNVVIGGDNFAVTLTNMTINGVAPSTINEASTLLNSLFSS